jgi:APA family basic amino acid/polyamine antiporter
MANNSGTLRREIGFLGAISLGLGSILGTGVFVSVGLVVFQVGEWIWLALLFAGILATCNGLSSAQLAATYPVSGGTYEYAYRVLHPWAGICAGWLFLIAKSASAATASLGVLSFSASALSLEISDFSLRFGSAGLSLLMTGLIFFGLRRSNQFNTVIVLITTSSLVLFIIFGALQERAADSNLSNAPLVPLEMLEATALLFVAYTGYGRIATLGEEVRHPRRTIPLAICSTLGISWLIYTSLGWMLAKHLEVNSVLGENLRHALSLGAVVKTFELPWLERLVQVGAITAMLGVLLNLILGLSRVYLAFGRRNDLPKILAKLDAQSNPRMAVLVTGVVIAALCLLGDVLMTWSLSAVTVLLYYGITNLAALRLGQQCQMFPKWISILGLFSCGFLSIWVQVDSWLRAAALVAPAFALSIYIRSRSNQTN